MIGLFVRKKRQIYVLIFFDDTISKISLLNQSLFAQVFLPQRLVKQLKTSSNSAQQIQCSALIIKRLAVLFQNISD